MADTQTPDPRFYGRRKGKPLKPGQQALLETLYPRVRLDLPPEGETLDLAALFDKPVRGLSLEIGFGSGEHLAHQAAQDPGMGFIGAEPFLNGISKFLKHYETLGLDNVRIYGDDVRPLLAALPDACLDRVFLLFPDPWPKARHWKRRFVNPWNLDELGRVMKDGAELRVASDDRTYIRWTLRVAPVHPLFTWRVGGPEDWRTRWPDAVPTRYEKKAIRGTPYYFTFTRVPRLLYSRTDVRI